MTAQQGSMTTEAGHVERNTLHSAMRHKAGQYLQDGHAVCRRKYDAQRQAILRSEASAH